MRRIATVEHRDACPGSQTIAKQSKSGFTSSQTVEVVDREIVNPLIIGALMRRHGIEPTKEGGPPGRRAEFAPHFVQSLAKSRLGWEAASPTA